MSIRVLVCGGRNYVDSDKVAEAMDLLHKSHGVSCVIHGAARGADTEGRKWAEGWGIETIAFPANWDAHGRAAGFLRNAQMLKDGKPDLVVAFPGGNGTADMVRKAEKAKVYVLRPYG